VARVQGNRNFIEIVDNYTRKTWVLSIRHKSDAPSALETWRKEVELATKKKTKTVRTDNGSELKKTFKAWKEEYGVRIEFTVHYTSHQNGVAERAILTTEEGIRAMLKESKVHHLPSLRCFLDQCDLSFKFGWLMS
jgi:transposase InsO family protein